MGNRTDTASVIAGNRYSSFHGTSVGYDADGNVILKNKAGGHRREYAWTADNLLLTALLDSTAWVRYDYNAYGEPVRKLRSTATSAWWVDSYFLWDRGQLLAEFDSAGKRRADYIYSPGVDEPFAETLGDSTPVATRYHQQDALGNVIGTIAGGDSSQTASYDSWGVPALSGNADNRLLWKGLMWEGDVVSLYYARNRWYDPEMGRFVSEDPIGHDGGDNLYAFSGDDPIGGSDPSGLGSGPPCEVGNQRWVGDWPYGYWVCDEPPTLKAMQTIVFLDQCDSWSFAFAPTVALPACERAHGTYQNDLGSFVNFSAGLGDGLLLGTGPALRRALNIEGVNRCSDAYRAGGWASFAIGVSRLAYAGLAKGISLVAASGAEASTARQMLKQIFRLGLGDGFRAPMLGKYATDEALRSAAGRTNAAVNGVGAGVAAAGGYHGTGAGCH